ncbi:LAMI_0D03422g1_1 [Lachancea mirantina]|uniref:LAMI_0D03422g1_1 n=1 Tax=Lachancea mirantina TaxID=1230905 RepID=A0A1G4JAB3_9SACH|nr:LAMI_0D03422g1_1 [Lachancea mirantina]
MDLEDIIESFKSRVNKLSQDWEALSIAFEDASTPDEEVNYFKARLELVQEQNSAIIVNLDQMKQHMNLDDGASNNVFNLLAASSNVFVKHPQESNRKSSKTVIPPLYSKTEVSEKPSPEGSTVRCGASQEVAKEDRIAENEASDNNEGNDTTVEDQENGEYAPSSDYSFARCFSPRDKAPGVNVLQMKPFRNITNMNRGNVSFYGSMETKSRFSRDREIEAYGLKMAETPRSVAELYREFDDSLRIQIMEFEKKFGKGQLSRIPKIRTYQRRRALVSEIDKYARFSRKSTPDAIQFFENILQEKNKTVPWLYNNLGKVLAEYL